MDCKFNEEKCIELTNKKLKKIGINKTLDEMYDIYGIKSKPENKLLKKYLESVGIGTFNPYHIYNHYYYFGGLNREGEIVN